MPRKLPFTHHIPDAHYRCEGADLGTEKLSEIHYRDDEGGYFPPDQLFFVKIVDHQGEMQCESFFCENCIAAYGLKITNKLTLKEAIRSKVQQEQEKANDQILRGTGNTA